jgi:23S rRNA 5-hydroxycytidine C2501 synthase
LLRMSPLNNLLFGRINYMEKENKITRLELLSPANNLEAGCVAILAGADAVYIGGPSFGARAAAGNSWEDIARLVAFAHQYYAKVYVALNTIFFEEETKDMEAAAIRAYEIGVDALIIQDMGIMEMNLPSIPLFASTQCDNSSPEKIKFLAEAGFSRVILARELSLAEIKKVKSETNIELEVFIHGAICISCSGHCYFSQALCGKSANRGQCAQICRQPFSLIDGEGNTLAKEQYLLSAKDMNLSAFLTDLIEAGATSFKIEGRLKDAAYVANTTAKYRKELDKIIAASDGKLARASSGITKIDFIPDLAKSFNRGFTEYFLRGRQRDIISPRTPKSLGEFIGKVESASKSKFSLDRKNDLRNGDGVCWFDREGELVGTYVNAVKEGSIYPNKVLPLSVGTEIYRNENPSFEKAVLSGLSRRVAVDFIVKENKTGFAIEAIDEDGNSVELKFKAEKSEAKKAELALKNWQEQLGKLGETIFSARDIIFSWEKPYFIPLSLLNDWRRRIAAALLKERVGNYTRQENIHIKTDHPYSFKKLDYSYNIANSLAKKFYERHGATVAEMAFELQNNYRGKKLMTCKHCLKFWLGACPRRGGKSVVAEPLYLAQNGKKFPIKFDCGNCRMEIYF